MEQIAMKEGLTHYLTNESQKDLLDQILEGLPKRIHKDPWRAAKGHKQYEYTCESMKKTMNIQESSMELQASNGDIATHDWEEVVTRITGGQGTRSIGNGSRTTSGTNKPKAVEVTEEQKNKQDLIKNLQRNLQSMEKDQRTFIRVNMLDKSNLPATFPPLITKYHKLNQILITRLISALDEIKPMDISQIQYDKYRTVMDKRSEVRDEYLETLKVGETMMKLT